MELDNHRSQERCQARRMMPLIPLSRYYCSAWLLFVQYKKKPWTSTWSMNFFVLLPKTWTHARIIQQPQSIHATQASMPQFICAHKTWSDGGENSNHTNNWKPCNTNPIPNFSFLLFLFLYHDNSTNWFRIFTIPHFLESSHPLIGYFLNGKMLNLDLETMV